MSGTELLREAVGFIGPLAMSVAVPLYQEGVDEVRRRKTAVAQLAQQAAAIEAEQARVQRIAEARLPEGRVTVNTFGGASGNHERSGGSLMLVGTGSLGQNGLVASARMRLLNGQESDIGSMLLTNNNTSERERFPEHIPPCFHDRVVLGSSPGWGGGMANKSTSYVLDHIHEWGGPLTDAAMQAADLHERRTGHPPAQIIFFWSLGGQAPVGLPIIDVLRQKFPRTQIVGYTSLPEHERNRSKFAELKGAYEACGVDIWVVSDRLLRNWVTADLCMQVLSVAATNAQRYDDEASQFNNMLALLGTESPGSILTFQYAHEEVVAKEWRVEGELLGYCVDRQRVKEVTQRLLAQLEHGKGSPSVAAPIGELGTSIFDMVMPTLGYDSRHARDDVQWLSDQIEEGYRLRLDRIEKSDGRRPAGLLAGLANYELKFGGWTTMVDPDRPVCRVVALRLAAVKDGAEFAEHLVAVPNYLRLPHACDYVW